MSEIKGYFVIAGCFLCIIVCTVLLGVVRNEYIVKFVNDSQVFGKLLLLPVNFLYIYFFSYQMTSYAIKNKLKINFLHTGIILVLIAVGLEFIIGFFLENKPFKELLNEYNILIGNTWVFVLLMIMLFPVLTYRMKLK